MLIRAWSLFCSRRIYISLHFLPILLKQAFRFSVFGDFVCSVFKFDVFFKDF